MERHAEQPLFKDAHSCKRPLPGLAIALNMLGNTNSSTAPYTEPSRERQRRAMLYSDSIAMVNDYIRRFGECVAVELHPLDADGINAYVDRNVLLIVARMGCVAGRDCTELFRKLLELNFLATRSCCFAIDERKQRVYLRAMRALNGLHYDEFAELLETVASVAESMRTQLPELAD
jgi:hypothetical protein